MPPGKSWIRHYRGVRIYSCTRISYSRCAFSPVNASVLRNSKAADMSLSPPGCVSCCIRSRSHCGLVYSLSRIESSGEFANTTTPTREKDGEIVRNSTKSATKPNINLQRTHRLNLQWIHRLNLQRIHRLNLQRIHRLNLQRIHRLNLQRIHRLNLQRIHRFEVIDNFVLTDFASNPSD